MKQGLGAGANASFTPPIVIWPLDTVTANKGYFCVIYIFLLSTHAHSSALSLILRLSTFTRERADLARYFLLAHVLRRSLSLLWLLWRHHGPFYLPRLPHPPLQSTLLSRVALCPLSVIGFCLIG